MFGQVALAQFGVGRDDTLPDEGGVPVVLDGFTTLLEGGERVAVVGPADGRAVWWPAAGE
ncbi:hypothetical protein I1A49_46325 [Streptomyces malaysiensis subsp. malaysiensis]|uniref:Uncharacterized protein n=1 Tax=Streptomyces malaysiensis TaxID=92644 RepID=A0ABX6WIU0_STRMQ|nr:MULTISPECIES: hypothetical protein [Streptomyces]QPI61345.1 hypothetical protein I1A49_46325 [Streptomyces solisilvae]UHH23118.1 hypothetical protein LUV23_46475 [Streptomyces sp. HNM0561]